MVQLSSAVVSKRVFSRVDNAIFICLRQWARRTHPKKSPSWLKQKYFEQHGGRNWAFFGASCDNEGKPHKVRLLLASSTPIQRHVNVKSAANPYDPAQETYFEKREGDYGGNVSGDAASSLSLEVPTRILPRVQHQDHPDHRITGWRIHYCVLRVHHMKINPSFSAAAHDATLRPSFHDASRSRRPS